MELAQQDNPFNLTLLTADTHFEDGYPCALCSDEFDEDMYANVIACASRQVSEFVEWVQRQPFYKNTTIVLVGDHPTMDSNFCGSVDNDYIRKVYTSFINPAVEVETTSERNYTTFDNFPTTLSAIGADIEGDRLGLGTNIFSGAQTLAERFGIETEEAELSRKSKLMEELARVDEEKDELLAREGEVSAADVVAGEYQFETGVIPVIVKDIYDMQGGIKTMILAVWTNEDQSNLQWIQMDEQEDGSYFSNIGVSNFGYKEGECQIHSYAIDNFGNEYMMGETKVQVK